MRARRRAKKVYRIDRAPLVLHAQSSMRMGKSEKDSVLDANAEARAVKRLFIADNSALANALGGPDPTLTDQALEKRAREEEGAGRTRTVRQLPRGTGSRGEARQRRIRHHRQTRSVRHQRAGLTQRGERPARAPTGDRTVRARQA
ncbi:GMC family oxidoreductase [Amycolatopsis acidiphila]|nr:GMC oxidoreductase [Amycolatopsis acidiphila]UIJ57639.1 GMC family oxidoreductase [Amycolatopsis acidiphila]